MGPRVLTAPHNHSRGDKATSQAPSTPPALPHTAPHSQDGDRQGAEGEGAALARSWPSPCCLAVPAAVPEHGAKAGRAAGSRVPRR